MGKGGGHSKGQTMPFAVVWSWAGGASGRTAKWTKGAVEEAMRTMLRTANHRESELDVRIVNRATGETVKEPQRCLVCRNRWATEFGRTGDDFTLCSTCDEDDLPAVSAAAVDAGLDSLFQRLGPPAGAFAASLIAALQAKGLEPSVRQDGTVTVTANGIPWTLRPEPHAVTGEPCGVWSVVGPAGPRGQFVTTNAAEFIAHRATP